MGDGKLSFHGSQPLCSLTRVGSLSEATSYMLDEGLAARLPLANCHSANKAGAKKGRVENDVELSLSIEGGSRNGSNHVELLTPVCDQICQSGLTAPEPCSKV